MKMIEAIIQPHKLDAVRDRLARIGVEGMTVTEVRGFGRQRGHAELYRGSEYTVSFVPKVKIEVLTCDAKASQVAEAVKGAARTGQFGDGKICVVPVQDALRIRTGERGEEAV
jgi:nitrogen regulatory protein P-II 1